MAIEEERKKRIMEHLARSSGKFLTQPATGPARKQKVMDHVRRSLG